MSTLFICMKNTSSYVITQIQTTKMDSNDKRVTSYDVLSNKKLRRVSAQCKIKTAEKVNVDPHIFSEHLQNNKPYLKVTEKKQLYDQRREKVNDPNYWKMLYSIAKNVHLEIYKLTLFKTSKSYYAYLELNQWILNAGILYKYSPSSDVLTELCDLNRKNIVNINE